MEQVTDSAVAKESVTLGKDSGLLGSGNGERTRVGVVIQREGEKWAGAEK